jgi:hypothetical protein
MSPCAAYRAGIKKIRTPYDAEKGHLTYAVGNNFHLYCRTAVRNIDRKLFERVHLPHTQKGDDRDGTLPLYELWLPAELVRPDPRG